MPPREDSRTGETLRSPVALRFGRLTYLLHLAAPAALLIDVLCVAAGGPLSTFQQAVAGGSLLWLAGGGLYYVRLLRQERFPETVANLLLTFYCGALMLGLGEAALRVLPPEKGLPRLLGGYYPPNTRAVSQPDPEVMPGISGEARFTVNESGVRGPSFKASGGSGAPYRIVTVGGSSTECLFLDDTEEWPHLLMQHLNQNRPGMPVVVGNTGVSGHTAVDHLVLLQTRPRLREAELWLFLFGVNDLSSTLAMRGEPTQNALESRARQTLIQMAPTEERRPRYARTYLYQLLRWWGLWLKSGSGLRRDGAHSSGFYLNRRKLRRETRVVPLPGLTVGLAEYGRRVEALARLCHMTGKRCVFLTQPTIWWAGLGPEEERLLWMGWVGSMDAPEGFVSAADLAKAMESYNRVLLGVCQRNNLECYDLAAVVPKDRSAFYDDCHFNENGAQMVARYLAGVLTATVPFPSAPTR